MEIATSPWTLATVLTLTSIALPLIVWFLPSRRPRIARVDMLGKDPGCFGFGLTATMKEFNSTGYRKALDRYISGNDTPYFLYALERTILPTKYLPELASLPDTKLSSRAHISKRHHGKYNGLDIIQQGHVHADVARTQLTNSIGPLLPFLNEELHSAAAEYIMPAPTADGSFEVPIHDWFFSLVVRMTSRAYVGLPLAHDQEWLKLVSDHPRLMSAVTVTLKKWPSSLRPIVAPFLSSRQRLNSYRQQLHDKLDPLIEERRKHNKLPKQQRPLDMLQWLVDAYKGSGTSNDSIISNLMFLNLAALNTTSGTLLHIINELCQRREYIKPLQDEANSVMTEERGVWSMAAMRKLRKLDSFMKETQRVNPSSYFAFSRLAMQTVQLSDGLVIPKGESIGVASSMVGLDELNFSNADQFDGFRFERLRQEPGQENRTDLLFSGTGQSMMGWGLGRQTCPGRWYADAQIKLIMVMLLTEYGFSFPEGQEKKVPNVVVGEHILPKFDQKIVLRKMD